MGIENCFPVFAAYVLSAGMAWIVDVGDHPSSVDYRPRNTAAARRSWAATVRVRALAAVSGR